MTDKNPYRTLHARMSPPGAAWDEGFAAGRAAATPPDGTNPHDDRNRMTKARREGFDEGWAARAAATPDPPAANPWRNINVNHLPSVKLRDAWDDGWAAHAAASPDERLREALERIVDLPLVDDSDADRMREIAAEALPWKPGSDDPR